MCHTNTRSRLRGRELNYGLDVEQFLKYLIRGITTSIIPGIIRNAGMPAGPEARMHELRIKFFRFTIIPVPGNYTK